MVSLIVSSNTAHAAQTKVLAGISMFMYIMATMHVAVRWFYARRAFIANGETEETRFFALIDSLIAGGPLWVPTISSIVASINILTADCVIVRMSCDSRCCTQFQIRYGGAGSSGEGIGGSSSFPLCARYAEPVGRQNLP